VFVRHWLRQRAFSGSVKTFERPVRRWLIPGWIWRLFPNRFLSTLAGASSESTAPAQQSPIIYEKFIRVRLFCNRGWFAAQ
jgi:hypothetical protein